MCYFNRVEYVVIDECDKISSMSLFPDLKQVLSYLPVAKKRRKRKGNSAHRG